MPLDMHPQYSSEESDGCSSDTASVELRLEAALLLAQVGRGRQQRQKRGRAGAAAGLKERDRHGAAWPRQAAVTGRVRPEVAWNVLAVQKA